MGNKPNYWAVLPAQVRYDANLPPNAKLLYAEISALTNEAGYCYASNAYFEDLFSLSERTVIRLIRELEKAGYVRIEDAAGGKEIRKVYAGLNPLRPPDKNVSAPVTKMAAPPDKNVTPHNSINNNINNKPPIAPQGGRREKHTADWKPERFEAFWKFYPPVNGKRPAKGRAIRAWDKLRPDDETIAMMGKALSRDKQSPMWQKGIGIPYASSWLNSRAWEDEVVDNPSVSLWADSSLYTSEPDSGWAETGEVF